MPKYKAWFSYLGQPQINIICPSQWDRPGELGYLSDALIDTRIDFYDVAWNEGVPTITRKESWVVDAILLSDKKVQVKRVLSEDCQSRIFKKYPEVVQLNAAGGLLPEETRASMLDEIAQMSSEKRRVELLVDNATSIEEVDAVKTAEWVINYPVVEISSIDTQFYEEKKASKLSISSKPASEITTIEELAQRVAELEAYLGLIDKDKDKI